MANDLKNCPGILIERAKAKGLVSQATLLSASRDEPSHEQARLLWEEALSGGRLDPKDELTCHYSLGSYYLSRGDLGQGLPHEEFILAKDPDLDFMTQVDDSTKGILRAELYVRTSAAFKAQAKEMVKSGQGLERSIACLQQGIDLLRKRAAPCLFLELSELNRRAGNLAGAGQALRWAIDAPTYGAGSQEAAKRMATKLLGDIPVATNSSPTARSGAASGDLSDLDPGRIVEHTRKWPKRLLWATPAVLLIGASIFFAIPSPYRKHFKQAKTFYSQGLYSEAMGSVAQAKARKNTEALSTLEKQIQAELDEIRDKERQATLQREYETYYSKALTAFNDGRAKDAQGYALIARDKKETSQVSSLLSRIESELRRQAAFEEERQAIGLRKQQAAADDDAFRTAIDNGSEAAMNGYLAAYPDGRHAGRARERIAVRQRWTLQAQESQAPQSHTRTPDPVLVQRQQPTETTLRTYLEDALRRLEERRTASTPKRPNAPTIDVSKARERDKTAWTDQTLRAIDAALGALKSAMTVAEQISNQRAMNAITRWTGLAQKARDQLVSKKILSDASSFTNQRQVIKEMREFLYR